MEAQKTHNFHAFWIFERDISSQDQFIYLETPGHQNKIKKIWKHYWKYHFYISRNLGTSNMSTFWSICKRRAPNNDEDPRNIFFKILDVNLISIKNMKWQFGNMDQISFGNIKHFEIKKPNTKKP